MPRLMFTPLASADIEEAYAWYEGRRAGLGDEFRLALEVVWTMLEQFPGAGPVAHRDLRRVLVPRFPYAIYYRANDVTFEVRACLHQRRDPRDAIRRA